MPVNFQPSRTAGGKIYASPFRGPIDHTAQIAVDITALTSVIDAQGWLKPGVPLTKGGALIGVQGVSAVAAAVADDDNTGNGTVGSLAGKVGGKTEVITLTARDATHFEVRGSVSGILADLTVGTPYVSAAFNATVTAGVTPFAANDQFTLAITAADMKRVYGFTIEPLDVLHRGPYPTTTLAADIAAAGTQEIGVATMASLDRAILENILERALTADELAGLVGTSFIVEG